MTVSYQGQQATPQPRISHARPLSSSTASAQLHQWVLADSRHVRLLTGSLPSSGPLSLAQRTSEVRLRHSPMTAPCTESVLADMDPEARIWRSYYVVKVRHAQEEEIPSLRKQITSELSTASNCLTSLETLSLVLC